MTWLVRTDFHLIVVNVFVGDKGQVLFIELTKLLIDDNYLVVAADDIGFCRRLALHGRDGVAGVTFEKETLLDRFRNELLALRLVPGIAKFLDLVVNV